MSLVVIAPGAFSTIQDLGRTRFRSWGVPVGGSFDAESANLANALVGNGEESAVIEMTYLGGTFEASAGLALGLCGAPMPAELRRNHGQDVRLRPPTAFSMRPGDRLVLGATSIGARTYLAVHGGWRMREILGSRSSEKPLRPGDVLPCLGATTPVRRVKGLVIQSPVTLRVVDGPDFALCDSSWLKSVHSYEVDPRSDRMGIRFLGKRIDVEEDRERLSTPVAPGAVQVAGGLPLVLGVACGTMGGYPHVAQVVSADISRVAQLRPGESVRFERVSLAEARDLHFVSRNNLRERCRVIRSIALDGIFQD